MPKLRSTGVRPLLRKSTGVPKTKLSVRKPRVKAAADKNKKKFSENDIVHLHQNEEKPAYVTREIPWWIDTENRGMLQFPPGPGPGPFPPGPGPGPFPPGPGPGPFPPGLGPGPFPIPIPIPIPGPQPIPSPGLIAVRIFGGAAFPGVNTANLVPYYPGITIRQALEATGLVAFGPAGLIRNVAGIPIFGNVEVRLRYNGRVIPQTLLSFPAEPGSTISLELCYTLGGAIPVPL